MTASGVSIFSTAVVSLTLRAGEFAHVPMGASALYLATLSKAAGFPVRLAPADASCAIQFLGTGLAPKALRKPEGEACSPTRA